MITTVPEIFQRFDIILLMIIAGASIYSIMKNTTSEEILDWVMGIAAIALLFGGITLLAIATILLLLT